MKTPPELDRITYKVLAYNPDAPTSNEPLKIIAGAPDRPLVIGDIEIPCYVLEGAKRVLSIRGLTAGIGLNPEAGFRMPQFMAIKAVSPFVNKELVPALNAPIVFQNPAGGGTVHGYPAEILEHIIDAVLDAQQGGKKVADALHPFCGFVVYRHFPALLSLIC